MLTKQHEQILKSVGLNVSPLMLEQLDAFCSLISEWNSFASLVSVGDLAGGLEGHVLDSLCLSPLVIKYGCDECNVLDIGSGGGFPAIPLKIALPGLKLTLLETSVKKVGFLRKVIGFLGFEGVDIVNGQFPLCAGGFEPDIVTARAVEKPDVLRKEILKFMHPGCTFLAQSGDWEGVCEEMFHVEHIVDELDNFGLRRGRVVAVTRVSV